MRDLSAELKSLNADWRALRDAAESWCITHRAHCDLLGVAAE